MKRILLIIPLLSLSQHLVGQSNSVSLSEPLTLSPTTIYKPVFLDTSLITADKTLVWSCNNGLVRHNGDQKDYLDLRTLSTCQYSYEIYQKTESGYKLIDRQPKVELIKTSDSTLTYTEISSIGESVFTKALHFDMDRIVKTDSSYVENPSSRKMELTVTNLIEVK